MTAWAPNRRFGENGAASHSRRLGNFAPDESPQGETSVSLGQGLGRTETTRGQRFVRLSRSKIASLANHQVVGEPSGGRSVTPGAESAVPFFPHGLR